ncbi:hypothetical protein BC834DRAFT_975290 [Gloeopeniophorella convolvens]|nr:hypothetical protein BC834DRAFT_975290 [Gloeopeniophorella convolvens]
MSDTIHHRLSQRYSPPDALSVRSIDSSYSAASSVPPPRPYLLQLDTAALMNQATRASPTSSTHLDSSAASNSTQHSSELLARCLPFSPRLGRTHSMSTAPTAHVCAAPQHDRTIPTSASTSSPRVRASLLLPPGNGTPRSYRFRIGLPSAFVLGELFPPGAASHSDSSTPSLLRARIRIAAHRRTRRRPSRSTGQGTERPPKSHTLELNAYMTKPTTCLARYPLLLKADVLQVVTLVREFLAEVNLQTGLAENRFNLLQFDHQLVFRPGERAARRVAGRQRRATLLVFLLDHALLMVKQKKKADQYKVYHSPIPLELLVIATTESGMRTLLTARAVRRVARAENWRRRRRNQTQDHWGSCSNRRSRVQCIRIRRLPASSRVPP